jgi:hypothetical protein
MSCFAISGTPVVDSDATGRVNNNLGRVKFVPVDTTPVNQLTLGIVVGLEA